MLMEGARGSVISRGFVHLRWSLSLRASCSGERSIPKEKFLPSIRSYAEKRRTSTVSRTKLLLTIRNVLKNVSRLRTASQLDQGGKMKRRQRTASFIVRFGLVDCCVTSEELEKASGRK